MKLTKNQNIMKSPKHLGHKPLVSVNDYNKIDGIYRGASTDAKALSIGHAQYDYNDISMKVWRKRKRWSPQSEELPIHRNLDLTILLLHVLFDDEVNPDSLLVKSKSLITEDQDNGIQAIRDFYEANKDYLEPRLKEMRELLNKMK